MSKQKTILSCEEVENTLIRQNIENISETEQQLVENHLLTCQVCKKYEYILLKLKNTLAVVHQDTLMPDPRIKKNISKRISTHSNVLDNIWQFVLDIFEYRIPVYQALGAMTAITFLLIAYNAIGTPTNRNIDVLGNSILLKGVVENINYRLDSLQLIERQRIGVSVSEDSILTQFIRPIM
jgi:hypothetical protein